MHLSGAFIVTTYSS